MKRKPSQELVAPASRVRASSGVADACTNEQCFLLQALAQYGLLSAIMSNLFPKDLYALAATSKAAYRAILCSAESRQNLLNKMVCDGSGVLLRRSIHQKSPFFAPFGCIEYITCGTTDETRNVKSRPCVSCAHTTCNECRIHCVYQSIFQYPDDSDDPDAMPSFSGFALLSPHEMGILSPSHVGLIDGTPWRDPALSGVGAYHDQGFLDVPLVSDAYAPPESVTEIIHYNLGAGPLKLSHSSTSRHPSLIIQPFWEISEDRKRMFCDDCFAKECNHQEIIYLRKCRCTLKSRLLDRWLCLNCYQAETKKAKDFPRGTKISDPTHCSCGRSLRDSSARVMCLWCYGELTCPMVAP